MIQEPSEAQDPPPGESWAFLVRLMGQDAYLISTGEEVSLVNKSTLIKWLQSRNEGA